MAMIENNSKETDMKVLFIAGLAEFGGSPNSFMEMVDALAKNYEITPVIMTGRHGLYYQYANSHGYEVHVIPYVECMQTLPYKLGRVKAIYKDFKWRHQTKKLVKLAEEKINLHEIDLIHTNIERVDLGAAISEKHKITHVCHIREFGDTDFNCISIRHNYIKYLNDRTDAFLAISNAVALHWIKLGLDKNKMEVVYNGVKNEIAVANKLASFDSKIHIVMAGTYLENKGQMQLVNALHLLNEDLLSKISVDFWGKDIVGYKKELVTRVQQYDLNEIVCFHNYSTTLSSQLSQYDIGIMASKAEGFGRVTVEYMYAGLAVIASDTGANPEIIDDGVNGLLYHYNDAQSMASKLVLLINNARYRETIAERGKVTVTNRFTPQINAKNIFDIYKKALHNN